jgi:ABC-type multidrug transport system fused ATPase/permease subunit
VLVALTLLLTGTGLSLLQPWLAGRTIDSALVSGGVTVPVLVLTGFFLLQAVVETVGGYLLERLGEGVVLDLRTRLVRRLLWLRVPVLSEQRVGDLISRATVDTTVLRTVTARSLVQLVTGTVALVGTVVLMIVVDPLLFVIVLGTLLAAGGVVMAVLSRIEAAAEQAQREVGLMSAEPERALSAIRTGARRVRRHLTQQSGDDPAVRHERGDPRRRPVRGGRGAAQGDGLDAAHPGDPGAARGGSRSASHDRHGGAVGEQREPACLGVPRRTW